MGFKKKILAVAAVGALTVATAVPAMALENEFHGMYRLRGITSNFEGTSATGGTFYNPLGVDKKAPSSNFIEQRARLMYIAKANDDLKLVTHFELDYKAFGDNSYAVGRNQGAALGADSVNLETKNVYLDFNIPSTPVNVKVGTQGWSDAYKGIIVNNDMAGVLATAKYHDFTNSLGWFRLDDRGAGTALGKAARDLIILDGKYAVNKDLKVGASYYLLNDDSGNGTSNPTDAKKEIVHTVGLNASANVGPVTVDGFILGQAGNLELPGTVGNVSHIKAFAANAAAKMKLGPGTIRTSFLYTSGDAKPNSGNTLAFQSIDNQTSGGFSENNYYESNMRLLFRDKIGQTTDKAIVFTSNNFDQGVVAGFLGYDANVTDKVFANANAGFAAVARTNGTNVGATSNSNYLGTELNAEVGYKLYDSMTASLQGAYVILGDYFQGVAKNGQDPRDPYTARIVLNYAF